MARESVEFSRRALKVEQLIIFDVHLTMVITQENILQNMNIRTARILESIIEKV